MKFRFGLLLAEVACSPGDFGECVPGTRGFVNLSMSSSLLTTPICCRGRNHRFELTRDSSFRSSPALLANEGPGLRRQLLIAFICIGDAASRQLAECAGKTKHDLAEALTRTNLLSDSRSTDLTVVPILSQRRTMDEITQVLGRTATSRFLAAVRICRPFHSGLFNRPQIWIDRCGCHRESPSRVPA